MFKVTHKRNGQNFGEPYMSAHEFPALFEAKRLAMEAAADPKVTTWEVCFEEPNGRKVITRSI